jgi:hypothetical protein
MLAAQTSRWTPFEHQRRINEVERKLHLLKQETAYPDQSHLEQPRYTIIARLYLLATMIYLNRTAMHYSGDELQHRRLVEEALSLLKQVRAWEATWPFFIIGCETQSDSERSTVLQLSLAAHSDGRPGMNSWIKRMVEAFWNQNDLDTKQSLSYVDKLSAVIGACPFLPVFV